jgi:hypothetical protein
MNFSKNAETLRAYKDMCGDFFLCEKLRRHSRVMSLTTFEINLRIINKYIFKFKKNTSILLLI